jgi:hypothetical protein
MPVQKRVWKRVSDRVSGSWFDIHVILITGVFAGIHPLDSTSNIKISASARQAIMHAREPCHVGVTCRGIPLNVNFPDRT